MTSFDVRANQAKNWIWKQDRQKDRDRKKEKRSGVNWVEREC